MIVPYFAFGLSCLVVLHAYWFHIMLKILLGSLFGGGKMEDVYENNHEQDDAHVELDTFDSEETKRLRK